MLNVTSNNTNIWRENGKSKKVSASQQQIMFIANDHDKYLSTTAGPLLEMLQGSHGLPLSATIQWCWGCGWCCWWLPRGAILGCWGCCWGPRGGITTLLRGVCWRRNRFFLVLRGWVARYGPACQEGIFSTFFPFLKVKHKGKKGRQTSKQMKVKIYNWRN